MEAIDVLMALIGTGRYLPPIEDRVADQIA